MNDSFRLHPVEPLIQVGTFFYGLDQATEALRLAGDTIPVLPHTVSFQIVAVNAPPAPFVPQEMHLQPGYALVVIGFGALVGSGDKSVERHRHVQNGCGHEGFLPGLRSVSRHPDVNSALRW
jgi:hypothetical protein